jgi:hypothetical protein
MRVAAERRADGVYVAAGVELIEPEYRHQSALAPGGVVVTPSRVARLGDKLGTETAKRLRNATGHRSFSYTRTPVLKACACSAVFVGDSCTRHCPACKRETDLLSTRTAVRRFRAKQRQRLQADGRASGGRLGDGLRRASKSVYGKDSRSGLGLTTRT